VIFPARMHDVQTEMRRGEPFTSARTFWMLGSQRRLVRRWECDTFIPKPGRLLQISHTAAMGRVTSIKRNCWERPPRLPSSAMTPSTARSSSQGLG
jgi:hypothetical protein